MVAKEGFTTHGIGLSGSAIRLGKEMLDKWGVVADLRIGQMTELPYENESFDAVLDVLSGYCLDEKDFHTCLWEIVRVLKPGGRFFSYTPGKGSDAFQHHSPAKMIDASTLNGIHRNDSPYFGNYFPFRFVHPKELRQAVEDNGLEVRYLETVHRTYFNRRETFEYVVMVAEKK